MDSLECGMGRVQGLKKLVVVGREIPGDFQGESSESNQGSIRICALSPANAAALRRKLKWLQPTLMGLQTSIGMGDRLGLATPGHVCAGRATGGHIFPIFAQQSIREMSRTGRTPQQVMDAATWGMFEAGWRQGAGADADHLKTSADIDACLEGGFTLFTIDPGAFVEDAAKAADLTRLRAMAAALPAQVRPESSGLLNQRFEIEHLDLVFDEITLLRAAVKYGRALVHVVQMHDHLRSAAGSRAYELEVSVDETEQPTTHLEHVYIASELKRLGVKWISLAPRYVGRFDKGVDYQGSLVDFEQDFAGHAAIARAFGPYKLSLHSGSDKFSIYPIAARLSEGLLHVKTAGTSYLEALRTIAALDPEFMREIYAFSLRCYERDRLSYHVSAEPGRAPGADTVQDWPALVQQWDARQILHVAFGSVLTETDQAGKPRFRDRLMGLLQDNGQAYAANLEAHFIRHIEPLLRQVEA